MQSNYYVIYIFFFSGIIIDNKEPDNPKLEEL